MGDRKHEPIKKAKSIVILVESNFREMLRGW